MSEGFDGIAFADRDEGSGDDGGALGGRDESAGVSSDGVVGGSVDGDGVVERLTEGLGVADAPGVAVTLNASASTAPIAIVSFRA
ncbi:hypothetical protein [Actinomadura meridiana]